MQDRPSSDDPQLILKATPPRVLKTLLTRGRLSSTTPELTDKSVVVVQAPAGFGKTSLLSQWRREAIRNGAMTAWLSIDDRDNGTRFVQGLIVATRMAVGRANFGKSYLRNTGSSEGDLEALTNWLAEVARMAVAFELFLDDVHALPQSTLQTSLLYLFRNAPANLRIFLGSRRHLAVSVPDLLAHGQFAVVDADALRFTHDETISVVTTRFGSRANPDICARMHDLTEGWPLGLQLVMATIEKRPDLRDAVVGFSVRNGDIQGYFVECLVKRLPPRVENFLTRISILDALHPALCEAITDYPDSADLLQQLQAQTPIFLGGVQSDWARIHSLAREFLRDRFAAFPDAERRAVHERAAHWLSERRMFEAAAQHALHAGHERLAYEFMTHCLYDIVVAGQGNRIMEWVDRLPPAEIERTPRLRLAVAWTLAMSKRNDEATTLVTQLLDDPAADPRQRCESAEICASAAFFADDLDAMERTVAPWARCLPALPAMLHVVVLNQLAVAALYRGAPEKARHCYLQMPAEGLSKIGEYTRGMMKWVIAISHLWQGQVLLAEELLRSSLAHAEEECGRRSPVAALLASALAMVLWERDATEELPPLLANRLDVLERRCSPDAILMGYVCAARSATRARQERQAFDLLEALYALGETRGLSRLCVVSLAEQIRMHALHSRAEACSALLARLDRITTPAAFERWGLLGPLVSLHAGVARAYDAIASQDWKRVLAELSVAKPIAEQLRRGRDCIQISLLQALAMQHCGIDGYSLFSEAISMAETLGLERILADTHPELIGWRRRVRAGTVAAAAEQPNTAPSETPPARPAVRPSVSPSALLTPKEGEVLQLLAGNLSNKQIALALDVGDETVKWHLKNLFSKLDAGNRRHLLARARMIGVLDTTG